MHSKSDMDAADILAIDKNHIWHPYSAVDSADPVYPVKHAEGVEIILHDGTTLIDGMSSWWSAIHGYNHPRLNQAAISQIQKFSHVMFGGFTHEPAARLASTLVELSPSGLNKVFFSDSGSVAIEVAMKLALQFWMARKNNKQNNKQRFLSLRSAYHGDTFKAMSVCDPVTGMHSLFAQNLDQQIFSEAPQCLFDEEWQEKYIKDFQQKIAEHHQQLAAVILEPIVQGAGGMRFYSPVFLQRVHALCKQYDVLLIADEIATALGRTGKLFACEHANISPDIMCLGKTLTGGYLSLAATLCTDKIAQTICSNPPGIFMHGPTYMGNPLACAIASENIQLLLESDWQTNIQRIEKILRSELEPARNLKGVADVRVLGAIGVIEMKEAVKLADIQPAFVKAGIWLRPFGKLVYMMPPYIIDDGQLQTLCERSLHVLERQNYQ